MSSRIDGVMTGERTVTWTPSVTQVLPEIGHAAETQIGRAQESQRYKQMKTTTALATLIAIAIPASVLSSRPNNLGASPSSAVSTDDVRSETFRLERTYLIEVNIPTQDADGKPADNVRKVLDALTASVPLVYGKYDHVAFRSAPGIEQFRPLAGSRAGAQQGLSEFQTVRVSFSIPRDAGTLRKTIEAIRYVHVYEEPVINVQEGWASRVTGKGDTNNANKWWNQSGKATPKAAPGKPAPK
jgi:hypothetical protein